MERLGDVHAVHQLMVIEGGRSEPVGQLDISPFRANLYLLGGMAQEHTPRPVAKLAAVMVRLVDAIARHRP